MRLPRLLPLLACTFIASAPAATTDDAQIRDRVDKTVRPLMQRLHIPGMAVALSVGGRRHFFNYGVASRETGQPVTSATLFEIGSVTKTFTATLAAYARQQGRLSLSDSPAAHLPALRGSPLAKATLLDLATHTAGGLPLQFPDTVDDRAALPGYYASWKPAYPPATYRTYSNPGIGLLGMIAADAMQLPFEAAIESSVLAPLGMQNTFFHVPGSRMADYAQGHTAQDAQIRLRPGVLASEAYGIRSSPADMLRFIEANLAAGAGKGMLAQAMAETHVGYFRVGEMVQTLIWERYPLPLSLEKLLAGNSPAMAYQPHPVEKLDPPLPARPDIVVNKTGSTNGFGAYVAFVPAWNAGIVILANKNYPVEDRVRAAHAILSALRSQ
ncbi:MAG TPA: class C beta-lactamase [Noviherbaspirillum sp.]|jgi:CubicO group peptidase (beta-lactamase class C family)|uniref:class C beta-lactamase n=1 Tax=Noviherbaspirillum sp. TaxID=1926288 RepID=UPI002F92CB52